MLQSRTSVCAFENTIGRQLCNSGENVAKPSGDVEQNSARQECEWERNQHRVDGLLSDDVGTVVEHNDELLSAFFNADQIVDFLLSIGMRPFVELSFMPTALASGSKTVFHFCQAGRIPIDFVSTHHYPTDAVGHEDDDTETQLANSQRGVLREWAQDTRRRAGELPVYYTEWNSSSNPRDPRHDEPYSAAFVAKTALAAGAPDYLDGPAVERLHEASRLTRQACPWRWRKGFRDSQNHFALDQGPVILMIENYRSGLIWRLMRSCSDVVVGLRRAGFRGGWLTGWPPTTPGRQLRS